MAVAGNVGQKEAQKPARDISEGSVHLESLGHGIAVQSECSDNVGLVWINIRQRTSSWIASYSRIVGEGKGKTKTQMSSKHGKSVIEGRRNAPRDSTSYS